MTCEEEFYLLLQGVVDRYNEPGRKDIEKLRG
jgi:hypothetical protein